MFYNVSYKLEEQVIDGLRDEYRKHCLEFVKKASKKVTHEESGNEKLLKIINDSQGIDRDFHFRRMLRANKVNFTGKEVTHINENGGPTTQLTLSVSLKFSGKEFNYDIDLEPIIGQLGDLLDHDTLIRGNLAISIPGLANKIFYSYNEEKLDTTFKFFISPKDERIEKLDGFEDDVKKTIYLAINQYQKGRISKYANEIDRAFRVGKYELEKTYKGLDIYKLPLTLKKDGDFHPDIKDIIRGGDKLNGGKVKRYMKEIKKEGGNEISESIEKKKNGGTNNEII